LSSDETPPVKEDEQQERGSVEEGEDAGIIIVR